jgi:hypothetical protein
MSSAHRIGPLGPSVVLADFYQRRSRTGREYLKGRLGSAHVYITKTSETSRGDPVWKMSLVEGPHTEKSDALLAREIADDDATQ